MCARRAPASPGVKKRTRTSALIGNGSCDRRSAGQVVSRSGGGGQALPAPGVNGSVQASARQERRVKSSANTPATAGQRAGGRRAAAMAAAGGAGGAGGGRDREEGYHGCAAVMRVCCGRKPRRARKLTAARGPEHVPRGMAHARSVGVMETHRISRVAFGIFLRGSLTTEAAARGGGRVQCDVGTRAAPWQEGPRGRRSAARCTAGKATAAAAAAQRCTVQSWQPVSGGAR